ncbi:unnamed protein product [Tuber aestivum]|uniref:Uncharacterized protein n=1 Tax=Tuber aestivum TaxID=59557 RepID=A0A292Q720_9PEZI|nr:unnamed protein product [Tuber aestivum]
MATYGGTGGYTSYGGSYDSGTARQDMLPFFVSGEGIKRQVIQTDLPRYLGNNAYSRPGKSRQGVDGYWYTAYRPLTDAQINSLKMDSQRWSRERELMSHNFPGHEPPGYERSATFKDSLRTNTDGNNPNHPYPSFPENQTQNPAALPSYGTGPTPSYSHYPATPYGGQPAPPVAGMTLAPPNNRNRYEYMPPPDNRPWYDHELKQYVPPFNPPEDASSAVPRSQNRDDPPDPNAGQEPGFYGQAPYHPRN